MEIASGLLAFMRNLTLPILTGRESVHINVMFRWTSLKNNFHSPEQSRRIPAVTLEIRAARARHGIVAKLAAS
jgi:hypothetical protein